MNETHLNRFDIFFDSHFGIGLRWDNICFPVELSLALPFITITVGFGKCKVNLDDYEGV